MNRLLVTLILVLVLVASFVTMAKADGGATVPPKTAATDPGTSPVVDAATIAAADTASQTPPATSHPRRSHKATPGNLGSQTTSSNATVVDTTNVGQLEKDGVKYTVTVTYDTDGNAVGTLYDNKCLQCPIGKTVSEYVSSKDKLADAQQQILAVLKDQLGIKESDKADKDEKTLAKEEKEKKNAELRKLLCMNPDPKDKSSSMTKREKVKCLLDNYDNLDADRDDIGEVQDKIMAKLVDIFKPIRTNYNNLSEGAQKQADDMLAILDDSDVAGKRVLALIDASIAKDVETQDQLAFQQAATALQQAIALNNLPMYQAAENQLVALQRNSTAVTDAQTRMVKSANAYIAAANEDGDFKVPKSDVNLFNTLGAVNHRSEAIIAMEQSIAKRTNNKVTASTAIAASSDPYINMANSAFANTSSTSTSGTGTLNLGTPAALSAFVARDTDACGGAPCDPRAPQYAWGAWNGAGQPALTLGSTTGALRLAGTSITNQVGTGLVAANSTPTNGIIQIPTASNISSTAGTLNLNGNTNAITFRGTGARGS